MGDTIGITIVLIDDHKIIRDGIKAMINQEQEFEVIGEADNGRDAIKLCMALNPNIVLLDVSMPDLNGIEATKKIILASPKTKVIGLSIHTKRQFVYRMLKAGAFGYLTKDCSFNDIKSAIRSAVREKVFISPSVTKNFVGNYFYENKSLEQSPIDKLTPRETEVLQLLVEGKTRSQISNILCISPRTAETHRRHILKKLDCDNLADLVKIAISAGVTTMERS